MHPWILGGGLLLAGALVLPAAARPAAACPAPHAALAERFIAADCSDCWAAGDSAAVAGAGQPDRKHREGRAAAVGWTLDWLLPRGADAAMAAAALPEADQRLQRLQYDGPAAAAGRPVADDRPGPGLIRLDRPALPGRPGLSLRVASGPAWQGYFGLQLSLNVGATTRLPAGSTAWLALVEQIPAGAEGSALPRQLVRSVAGPLSLQALRAGRPFSHLRALRWPEGAQPTRLQARGWLEAPDGRVIAMAADRCD